MSDYGLISFTEPNVIKILGKPASVVMPINFTMTISPNEYKVMLKQSCVKFTSLDLLFHSRVSRLWNRILCSEDCNVYSL